MARDASRDPRLNRLTPQEQDIVQVSFDSFSVEQAEVDEEGETVFKKYITIDKLQEAFEYIGAASDIADIKMLINDVDENGDGKIDFDEWLSIMGKKFLGEDDDASTVHVFAMLDDNKDGYIPLVELRSLLMREGQAPLSEQEVDELLMFADSDSDGLVNYRTFLTWLANPYEVKKKAPAAGPTAQQGPRGRVRDGAGGAKAATKAGDLRASATGDLGIQSGAPDNEFGASADAPTTSTSTTSAKERRPKAGAKETGEATSAPGATESATAAPAEGSAPAAAGDRQAIRAQRQAREKEKAEKEKADRERKRAERQAAHQAKTAAPAAGAGESNAPGNEP